MTVGGRTKVDSVRCHTCRSRVKLDRGAVAADRARVLVVAAGQSRWKGAGTVVNE